MPYGYVQTDKGFDIDLDRLKASITDKTVAIIYNNYQNPLSAESSKEEMEAIAQLAIDHDLWVLADDAYYEMLYDGNPLSIVTIPGMQERTVILYTFSKKYAMTGWRLGWGVWPENLIKYVFKFCVNNHSCVNTAAQYGAIAALEGPEDHLNDMMKEFTIRRKLIVDGLRSLKGVECSLPGGSFFVFPNVKGTGMNGEAFTEKCLQEAGVAIIPGTA